MISDMGTRTFTSFKQRPHITSHLKIAASLRSSQRQVRGFSEQKRFAAGYSNRPYVTSHRFSTDSFFVIASDSEAIYLCYNTLDCRVAALLATTNKQVFGTRF